MKRGFTLIELLVVIAIIGLMSTVVFASVQNAKQKALEASVLSDGHQLQIAIELYKNTHGFVPEEDSGYAAVNSYSNDINVPSDSLTKLVTEGYLPKVPNHVMLNYSFIRDNFSNLPNQVGCGNQVVNKYYIWFFDPNDDFPNLKRETAPYYNWTSPFWYCVTWDTP